jgi:hypothetical protein
LPLVLSVRIMEMGVNSPQAKEDEGQDKEMLQIGGELETAVRRAAARADTLPEAFLEQLLELGLAQMEAASSQAELEPDADDAWRPPLGVLTARAHPDLEIVGRGYVPEPKAPRLFRARRLDGVAIASQIAFGPEAGPTVFVKDGPQSATFDVILPLHWIVIDMVPDAWRLVFGGIGDAVARLRRGAKPPPAYGANPAWGYPTLPDSDA